MKKMFIQYFTYLIRWQLSTPILSIVLNLLTSIPILWATVIANFIGGLIFFWVDKLIFKNKAVNNINNSKEDS